MLQISNKEKQILKLEQELAHAIEERDIAVSQFEQLKNEADPSTSTEIPELAKRVSKNHGNYLVIFSTKRSWNPLANNMIGKWYR